jgi:polysaccharide biosynthesis/export protein
MNSDLRSVRRAEASLSICLRFRLRNSLTAGILLCLFIRSEVQAQMNPQVSPSGSPSASPSPGSSGTSPASMAPTTAASPAIDQSHYVISPGDVLDVSVFGAPDLSQKSVVNSSGDIYMPQIDYVHIAGMHVEEAQTAVEQVYFKKQIIKVPHVAIVIASYSSGVLLMGEVGRQGMYPIVGSGRLFDILAEAGGTTANAGQIVTITRKDSTTPQTVVMTSDPAQLLRANVPVQQGDIIIVSKADVIYVVGEVLAPSGFVMDDRGPYTVMKVIAMAHGTTKIAKPSKARIVRRTSAGQTEIEVPLDKILASKAPDIPMQANDILFVPSSKEKQAAATAANVAVGLASGLAYYGLIYH